LPRHAPIVPLSEHQSTALQKKIQNRRNPRRKRLPRRESLGHTAGTVTLQPANLSRVDYPRAADLDSGQPASPRLLADEASTSCDFIRPGHMFPLQSVPGGVLRRTGHTEASVDLAKLAGMKPIAVICEVMNDDGDMARTMCVKSGMSGSHISTPTAR